MQYKHIETYLKYEDKEMYDYIKHQEQLRRKLSRINNKLNKV